MKISRLTLFTLFLLIPLLSFQQELRCNVQINSQKIQGTNRQLFQTLQTAVYEFMNNTPWTNHIYGQDERIECNVTLTLNEQIGSDEFRGSLQVQARRPIFGTSYNTTMLNIVDNNLQFRYIEFDQLEFSETRHSNNLTSILAYYAYIILGFDYDSFSYLGGTENLQNPKYRPIREVIYKYHRLGLDRMSDKLVEGRAEIADLLTSIQKVFREKPDPYMYLLQVFFDAKSEEFVNIFSESFPAEKTRVVNILSEIDNSNVTKYNRINSSDTMGR